MKDPIVIELEEQLANYDSTIEIAEGFEFSQPDTLRKVEFYSNSRYLLGQKDNLSREKPFFNVVNDKVNVAVRATDIDTKDIEITADEPNGVAPAFIFKKELQKWYKDANFGITLNNLSETRARYGGVIAKKTKLDKDFVIEVCQWKDIITDQSDFDTGLVIERHYMTPDKLLEKKGIWDDEAIDDAISFASGKVYDAYKGTYTSATPQVCIYEMHGVFPSTYIGGTDENKYTKQVHYIAYGSKKKNVVLFSAEEKELPYKYLAWRKVPGRTLGVGIVEDGFQAQMWTNDAVMKQREAMELASKVIYKSTVPNFLNNVLTDAENGTILDISEGGDVQQLNTVSNAIPAFDQLINQWSEQYQRVASVFEANTGENLPSGTPFRLAAVLNQEANSLFNYRREEMGLWLVEIFEDWVIPELTKRINKKHILASNYTPEELQFLDEAFSLHIANKKAIDAILNNKIVTQEDYEEFIAGAKDVLQQTGSVRYLEVPEDFFKDFKYKITINVTGEQRNKAVVLETLNSILTVVGQNPAILQDPALSQIFAKIVEYSGVGLSPTIFMNRPQQPMDVESNVTAPQENPTALPEQAMA